MENLPQSHEEEKRTLSPEEQALAQHVIELMRAGYTPAPSSIELSERDDEEGMPHIVTSHDPYEVRRNTPAKYEVDEHDPIILGYN